MTTSKLMRELGEFPFHKLKPESFRLEIASLPPRELEKKSVQIWIKTNDILKLVAAVGQAKILRVYPHLDYVLLKIYAKELIALVDDHLVQSVWNDAPTVDAGSDLGILQANQHTPALETWTLRSQNSSGHHWDRH